MDDQDLIDGFEACTLTAFHHQDHVRVAWLYLRRLPLLEALIQFSTGIKNFAAAKGKSELYHETITWAYIFLINERMRAEITWAEFAGNNQDLLNWQENLLKNYYSPERLQSGLARRCFLFPDLCKR